MKSTCLCLLITAIGASLISSGIIAQDKSAQRGFVRASQVIGMEVRDASDQNIGEVKDVMLDRETGGIAYAVVSYNGVTNADDRLFAVPWESLKTGGANKGLVLSLSKDRLEKAPGFAKDQWPDMADARWTNDVNSFYGTRMTDPIVHVTKANPAQQNAGREEGMNEDRSTEGTREIMTHAGKVKTFTRGNPAQAVVTTDRGDMQVDLAPMAFMEKQQLVLDPNADVSLKGYHNMRDGKDMFVVTEVTVNGKATRLRREDFSPLWTDAASDRTTGTSATVRGMGTNPAVRDMTGTVTYVDNSPCGESAQGRQITIHTADGDRVVGLGPGTYLDSQRWIVRPNETLMVRGYDQDRNGTRVFIVTEAHKGNEVWKLRSEDGTPLWR